VEAILAEHEVIAPLEETIKSLRDVSKELRLMITENREEVQPAVRSFRSIAENVDEMVAANKGKVDTTMTSFAASAARLDETTERMAQAVASLEQILSRIEHGQGTLGKLSRDDKLYRELLLATQNLNDLLRDVRKNPKRYLKIEIF